MEVVLTEPLLYSELLLLNRSMLSKVAMTYEQLTAAHSCYQVLHCTINNCPYLRYLHCTWYYVTEDIAVHAYNILRSVLPTLLLF